MSRLDMLRQRGHRWKVLGIGVAANASFSAAFQGIPTTAVFMRADYRLGNSELALALGLLGLGIAVSELPWGMLTDRWGDRRVLLLGLCTTALSLATMALFAVPSPSAIPSMATLACGMLLIGLLGGSVNGSSGRAVMAWFADDERGFAMSIRQTAVPVGGGIGALILPSLAAKMGFGIVYGVLALLCAASAYFAWRWLHEPPGPAAPVTALRGAGPKAAPVPIKAPAAGRGPLADAGLWRLALGIGVLCVPQFAVLTFAAIFLHDFCHAGVAAISTVLVTVQVGAAVMRVWSGRWTDRHRNRPAYLRTCTLLAACLFGVLAALSRFDLASHHSHAAVETTIAVVLVLGGIAVSAWHGVAYTELAMVAGIRRVGTALGMANTCAFVGFFLTPLAIAGLLAVWSWGAVWIAAAACALVAIPLFPALPKPPAIAVPVPGTHFLPLSKPKQKRA
jgi:MFS family permease